MGQVAKVVLVSKHTSLIFISTLFPLFAFLYGINPRNDSLNKFDNLVLFARYLRVENQFPIWTTINFGAISSLENLQLRPEETLAIVLSRILDLNSVNSIIYLALFLTILAMNYCFMSICEDFGILNRRLIFALILILDFVAFPFTQYWLHFLVIFNSVILLRIYLSLASKSWQSVVSSLIPISFVSWGGYATILPALALLPIFFVGFFRRSRLIAHGVFHPKKTLFFGMLTIALLNFFIFSVFTTLYFTENRFAAPGRSSAGIASLDSYLAPAGSGPSKFFELLGSPTIWQDTHLVISPIFIPFFVAFLLFRFQRFPVRVKLDILALIVTILWSALLILPDKTVSNVIYHYFPIVKLTRNPGFHSGILIPLLLLILGMMFTRIDAFESKSTVDESFLKEKKRNGKRIKKVIRKNHDTDVNHFARMHLCGWLIVFILYFFGYVPYPLLWTRALLGHLNNPLVMILVCLVGLLVTNTVNLRHHWLLKQKETMWRFTLKTFQYAVVYVSTIMVFSLGIFQMYFLSFVDYRNVKEMRPKTVLEFQDNNVVERSRISELLKSNIVNWENFNEDLRNVLISNARLEKLGYEAERPWMRLIDADIQYRSKAFQEFSNKSYLESVLFEQTPQLINDPNTSPRARLRNSQTFTTNLVSTSAHAINEDYCPSLGLVLSVSKHLSDNTLSLLSQSGDNNKISCSGKRYYFLDDSGRPAGTWFTSDHLNIGNGKATITFKVEKENEGRTILLIYRDAFSKFWNVEINGKKHNLQPSAEGFKMVKFNLKKGVNRVDFELDYALKLLVNLRLFIDPLLYLSVIFYFTFLLRRKSSI